MVIDAADSERAGRWRGRASVLCLVGGLLGLIVIAGWLLGVPLLTSFVPGRVDTKPRTGWALLAVAAAVCLRLRGISAPQTRGEPGWHLATGLALLTIALGVVSLVERTAGLELGIDRFLAEGIDAASVPPPSDLAVLGYLGLGTASLLLAWEATIVPAQLLALAVGLIAWAHVAGVLYNIDALQASRVEMGTGLPTALGFLVLGPAILLARPDRGITAIYASSTAGGRLARQLLLPAALTPVVLNWIALQGERDGWYPEGIGWVLDAVLIVGLLGALILWSSYRLHVTDAQRLALIGALQESEERYRRIVEDSPDAVLVKDRHRIQLANTAALHLLGASGPQEVAGRSPYAFVHPDDRSHVERELCGLLDTRGFVPATERRLLRVDGTSVDVELTASAVSVKGHRLAQVIARDISDRKRQVLALRESERRFRLIAETIREVFWIADAGLSTTVYVSPAYERIWGRSREALFERPEAFIEAVHPDDRVSVQHTLDEARRTRQPFEHEFRIVRPDGELRWIWDRGFPAGDGDETLFFVGAAQDATERRRAEARLKSSEQRFRATFEQAAVGMAHVAMDGAFVRVNPRLYQILGRRAEELLGLDSDTLIHPDDRGIEAQRRARMLAREIATSTTELRYVRSDGATVWVESTLSLVRELETEPEYCLMVIQDVSERRQLQEQLIQSQKMEVIGQLAGAVAHDFNNLLTIIHGESAFIAADPALPEAHREAARDVLAAAERAAALTRKLLLVGHRQVAQPRRLDLNAVIVDLQRMLTRLIPRNIEIAFTVHPRPLFVHADPAMLEQVILNLAVNARDAMPDGGRLEIATTRAAFETGADGPEEQARPGDYAGLVVADTGSGIAPDVRPHIFEPFFSTKQPGVGSGLGLATVSSVVKQHGGFVGVESSPGSGTTFRVWLPEIEPTSNETPRPGDNRRDSTAGTETILLVEDEREVRSLVRRALEHEGYHVLEAGDAEEALQRWGEHRGPIDLLVTDIVMPGAMTGRDLAAALKEMAPDLRTIFMSGHSVQMAARSLELAAEEHFLEKPFSPRRLLELVRRCLDEP